jgi:hypothetical protein
LRSVSKELEPQGGKLVLEESQKVHATVEHDELDDVPGMNLEVSRCHPDAG